MSLLLLLNRGEDVTALPYDADAYDAIYLLTAGIPYPDGWPDPVIDPAQVVEVLLEGSSFGSLVSSASEVETLSRESNYVVNKQYRKLRDVVLKCRVRGVSFADLQSKLELVQKIMALGRPWWLPYTPPGSASTLYFRVLRSPSFKVPYDRLVETQLRVDIELRLVCEPYIYGAEQTVVNAASVTAPATVALEVPSTTAPVRLDIRITGVNRTLTSACAGASFTRPMVELLATGSHHKDAGVSALGMRSTGTLTKPAAFKGYPADWREAVWWQSAPDGHTHGLTPGKYRVFVRVCDRKLTAPKERMRFAFSKPRNRDKYKIDKDRIPKTYTTIYFKTQKEWGWGWFEIGELAHKEGDNFSIWYRIGQDQYFDSVVFVPLESGFVSFGSTRFISENGEVGSPAASYRHDGFDFSYDDATSWSGNSGSGVVAMSGKNLMLSVVASNDTVEYISDTNCPVTLTVKCRPRFSSWRE
jgi:hypothetical protein